MRDAEQHSTAWLLYAYLTLMRLQRRYHHYHAVRFHHCLCARSAVSCNENIRCNFTQLSLCVTTSRDVDERRAAACCGCGGRVRFSMLPPTDASASRGGVEITRLLLWDLATGYFILWD